MKIVELNRSEYQNYEFDCKYTTKAYFDVSIKKKKDISISIKRKKYRRKQDKGFVAHLFEPFIEKPQSFAIFDRRKLVAVIEGSLETWNNRYRVWNLNVDKKYRKEGLGSMLFKHMEKVAKELGARVIILEVQSCNDPAINFYTKQGLHFVGLDTMAYTNQDIQNKEVRLEMGKRL
jgi:ribosomal protein S18 acetylase RimI-like enzyme